MSPTPNSGVEVIVQRRESFSVIPDRILEDKSMRPETRLVLAWLVGRPNGWKVYVAHVQRRLDISPARWARARREMQAAGYLVQIKKRSDKGRYVWTHIVSDRPDLPQPPIPSFSRDGNGSDGKPSAGEPGDIPAPPNQKDSYQQESNTCAISWQCLEEAQHRYPGWDIERLEKIWSDWVATKKEKPRSPDRAFFGWLKKHMEMNALPGEHQARLGLTDGDQS